VLIAKAVLIAAIYFAFFSNPPGAHLDQQDVAAAVLGPPARAETLRRADREEDMPHSVIDGNPR